MAVKFSQGDDSSPKGSIVLGRRDGPCGTDNELGAVEPFCTKISLLPDSSIRWLPEEMFLPVTSRGKNFHLEQERAFVFHQKG